MAHESSRRRVTASTPEATGTGGSRPFGIWQVLAGYVVAVLVAGVAGGFGAAISGDEEGVVVLLAGQAAFWAVLLAVVALARGYSVPVSDDGDLAGQFRWVDLVGVGVGVFAQVALLPLLYLPFRSLFDDDDLSAPAEDLLGTVEGAGLLAMGIGVVVIAPIVEELFFRGLLLGAMQRRWGTPAAVVASSMFFGATHFQPLQFAGLTFAGLVFALAVVRTGRLGTAIAVHAGFNATTFVALVMF